MRKRLLTMMLVTTLAGTSVNMPVETLAEEVTNVATVADKTEYIIVQENLLGDGTEIVESGSCGENATYTLDSEGVLTIAGTGKVVWTYYENAVKEIIIEDGITQIDEAAFYAFGGLKSVKLADSVTYIGCSAFEQCMQLETVEMSENLVSIDEYAFAHCPMLSVALPDSIKSIGDYAFQNCRATTSIIIPKNVTDMGEYVFANCAGLTDVTIPEGVTCIERGTFAWCEGLTSIEIPESVTSIGSEAFLSCSNLKSITIPESVTHIGSEAFTKCEELDNLTIPKNVTNIEGRIFDGYIYVDNGNMKYTAVDGVLYSKDKTEIKSVQRDVTGKYIIPDYVTSIGEGAFSGCSQLTGVIFPQKLTNIGDEAFSSCIQLQDVVLPKEVTHIGEGAFNACFGLTKIEVPEKVTSIEKNTFRQCEGLYKVVLPVGLKSIGEGAFEYCKSLNEIAIPMGLESIGDNAFSVCWNLDDMVLPEGMQSIGANAFKHSGVYKLSLPESITSIGEDALGGSDLTLFVKENSYAHQYAMEKNISYELGYYSFMRVCMDIRDDYQSENYHSQIVENGLVTIYLPPMPTREGYVFKGWYTEKEGGELVENGITLEPLYTKLVLYARWEEGTLDSNDTTGSTNDNTNNNTNSNVNNNSSAKTELTNAVVTLPSTTYTYTGQPQTPSITSVKLGTTALKQGADYTVSYVNNTNIGTATVTITGIGNYTGTSKATFSIVAPKGLTYTVGAYNYKVTATDEVAFAGLVNNKIKKVVIPKTVKIGGSTFKVTSIAAKALCKKNKITSVVIGANVNSIGASAFEGCKKLSKITIKSTGLKKVGKKAFKGIKANAKIKVPKKKLESYKKLFKNRGQGKSVKITK